MDILQNNLRKVNAKLLLYSQLYYESLQTRTKIISDLSSKIDRIGAEIHDSLIMPYQNNARTRSTTSLQLALSDLFQTHDYSTPLVSYYELLSSYVNKYIDAEQQFLKNMHMFKTYFNSPCGFSNLYSYSFQLDSQDSSKEEILSFGEGFLFSKLTYDNSFYPILLKEGENYLQYNKNNIISLNNIYKENYYYSSPS
jgi:hypothetical protein